MSTERNETIALDGGASMRALLTLPEGAHPAAGWPLMLVIHDAFGFSDDIRRIARRFAEHGYAALAPALYDGAGAAVLCVVRTFQDLQARKGRAFDRIEAARAHADALPEIDGKRLGITGFCLTNAFNMFARNHQNMLRCLWINILYGNHVLVFVLNFCGNFLLRNLTKQALPHNLKTPRGLS